MMIRCAFLILVLALLNACSSTIYTRVNAFQGDLSSVQLSGSVAVLPRTDEQGSSLEFAHYKSLVEQKLQQKGFAVVPPSEADRLAFVDYGVEKTQVDREGFRSGVVVRSPLTYSNPRVGLVLVDDDKETQYERHIRLVIATKQNENKPLYEVRGVSSGRCAVLSVVFDEILEAMLQDFPAASGSVKTIGVKGESKCR